MPKVTQLRRSRVPASHAAPHCPVRMLAGDTLWSGHRERAASQVTPVPEQTSVLHALVRAAATRPESWRMGRAGLLPTVLHGAQAPLCLLPFMGTNDGAPQRFGAVLPYGI